MEQLKAHDNDPGRAVREQFEKSGYFMGFHYTTEDMPSQLDWPDGTKSIATGFELKEVSDYIQNPDTGEYGTEVHIGYSFFYDPDRIEVQVISGINSDEDKKRAEEKLKQEGWNIGMSLGMHAFGYRATSPRDTTS